MNKKWWHGASIYHIYPRSFYDSNSDGVGDLPGITSKLSYLKELGVNAVWLSPFYPSPMADFGYDVSDYCNVDPTFGNLSDFDRLLIKAHNLGLKVIVDFVPNHTSSKHPWFLESRSSPNNPKRDWYIWRSGKDGRQPNNWISVFGGSAWEYDKSSEQYYLHTFLKEQPDLNWANPEVRQAMLANMEFWLKRGVDGFRIDAVSWLSKDPRMRNEPINPYFHGNDDPYKWLLHPFSCEGPKLFNYLSEMIELCVKYGDRFVITEAYPETDDEISHYLKYYEKLKPGYCAPFNFECISFPWDASTYSAFIDLYQEALLPAQPPIYNMGNHDKPRLATRIGPEAARTAAMLLLCLPGIPFIYYGDELGMTDAKIPKNRLQDPFALPGGSGRDPARTPMQWNEESNAGFSAAKTTWLPVNQNFKNLNVAKQAKDPESSFSLYKRLLTLRNQLPALKYGSYRSIELNKDVFCFVREHDMSRYTVVLNFGGAPLSIDSRALKGRVILSSKLDDFQPPSVNGHLHLRGYEGLLLASA